MGYPLYSTAAEDCVEAPEGRFQLGNGRRRSRAPYVDRRTGLRARVTPATAREVAKRDGCVLPTHADEERAAHLGFWTSPNIVRETPEETADRVSKGLGINHSLDRMGTIEWARRADAMVEAQLAHWDGDRPIFNWGKLWISEDKLGHAAPAGKDINNGWDTDPDPNRTHWIQDDGEQHNDAHVDNSQVFVGVWVEDLPSDPPRPRSDTGALFASIRATLVDPVVSFLDHLWHPELEKVAAPNAPASNASQLEAAGGPGFMPNKITTAPISEVAAALARAWNDLLGEEPKPESIRVLLAQYGIETGFGKATHCWNLGNTKHVKGDGHGWTMFRCSEVLGSPPKEIFFEPPHPQTWFRAFPTLDDGAADYLGMLHRRFDKSWPAVLAGSPEQFGHLLKVQGYYTANESAYVGALRRIFDQLSR
jgi:hypothetical protein